MKNYRSTQEQIWFEVLHPDLTQEHELMQELIKENKADAIKKLKETIKVQCEGQVGATKAKELNALYERHKPTIEEGISYQLITMDVFENENVFSGILNCRVNGEHLQIRF